MAGLEQSRINRDGGVRFLKTPGNGYGFFFINFLLEQKTMIFNITAVFL